VHRFDAEAEAMPPFQKKNTTNPNVDVLEVAVLLTK
jgi:hypothetical protein